MIYYKGLYLPDGERHLVDWMETMKQEVAGKPAYQLNKYLAALPYVTGRLGVVDIGANTGLWARVMARDFAWLHAFEPVPAYRECFVKNTDDLHNIALHAVALGRAPGRVGLRCPDDSSHGDTFVARAGEEANAVADVEMRTLDSYDLQDVDFIKIDCEGYELPVLEGARATLERCRPAVIVEQKPGKGQSHGYGEHDAVVFLQSLGMHVCREMSGDFIMAF